MPMPREFRALVERFNQLGCLLPPRADLETIDWDDKDTSADIQLVLAEMNSLKDQIYAYLAAVQQR